MAEVSGLIAKVDHFIDIISGHPHFNAAYKKLRKTIRHAVFGNLIFVFGPTGVGKSTLLRHLILEVLKEMSEKTSADKSILPIVRIEVEYPSSKQFSWKEFYRYALKSLQEPLIDKKLKNVPARVKMDLMSKNLESHAPGHELKMAFFNALERRKTEILLLDEAHHFAKGFEGDKLIEQLEYLKSIANKEHKVVVLVGTYKLLDFLNLSGQLSRRGLDVHFPRYKASVVDEMKQFIKIVKTFKQLSPLEWDDELLEDISYLYTYSAGNIGILKEWIDRALKEALDNNATTLSLMHLKSKELTIDKLKIITKEIIDGEALLTPQKGDLQFIQHQLGLDITPNSVSTNDGIESVPVPVIKPSSNRRQVGIRNAKRDPIGM